MVHHKFLWVGKKQTKKVEPQSHSDLAICYAMKEELLRLFELKDHTEAEQGWKKWVDAAIDSPVPAPAEFGRQKLKRLDGPPLMHLSLLTQASLKVSTIKSKSLKEMPMGLEIYLISSLISNTFQFPKSFLEPTENYEEPKWFIINICG